MNPLVQRIEELEEEINTNEGQQKYEEAVGMIRLFCSECPIQKEDLTKCMQCYLHDLKIERR